MAFCVYHSHFINCTWNGWNVNENNLYLTYEKWCYSILVGSTQLTAYHDYHQNDIIIVINAVFAALQCNAKWDERERTHTQTRTNEWKVEKKRKKIIAAFVCAVAILYCTQYFITIYLMSCWTVWRYLVSVYNMISCMYLIESLFVVAGEL